MIFPTLFLCETCGRSGADLPSDDAQDVVLFPGDDGSCCRAERQRIAHAYVVSILDAAMRLREWNQRCPRTTTSRA